jgi:uncharacterized membrane protein
MVVAVAEAIPADSVEVILVDIILDQVWWLVRVLPRIIGELHERTAQIIYIYTSYALTSFASRIILCTSPFYSPFSWGYSRPGVIVSTGPSFGGIFFFAGFFLLAALALSSMTDNIGSSISNLGTSGSVLGPGVSVAEISVALEVPDRDRPDAIMNVLERLASTARTDSRVGLQNLTSQGKL